MYRSLTVMGVGVLLGCPEFNQLVSLPRHKLMQILLIYISLADMFLGIDPSSFAYVSMSLLMM